MYRKNLGQILIQKAPKSGQTISGNSFNFLQISGKGRPEKIACPMLIGRALARKTSEAFPIFWGHIFWHVKMKKIL